MSRKIEIAEEYWTAYFAELDALAPHSAGSVAEYYSRLRSITAFACKDGMFFTFGPDVEELSFDHKKTTGTVEATLFRLTSALGGIGFNPFPDRHDFSLSGTDIGPGESKQLAVVLDRVAWFRGQAAASLSAAAAVQKAKEDHNATITQEVVTAPQPKGATGGSWH